jgi:tetratricopeptide (TPR) repeat protein
MTFRSKVPQTSPDDAKGSSRHANVRPACATARKCGARVARFYKVFSARLARWMAATIKFLTIVTVIWILLEYTLDHSIIIEPISVPEIAGKNGFTPEVTALRLADIVNDLAQQANTLAPHQLTLDKSAAPDFMVPRLSVSIQTIAARVTKFMGLNRQQDVTGEIIVDNGQFYIRLRLNGHRFYQNEVGASADHLENIMDSAARALLRRTQPYIYAAVVSLAELDLALEAADHALEVLPANDRYVKWAHNLKGGILQEHGLLEAAFVEYQAAAALDPKWALPHLNLAIIHMELGRRDDAIKEYRVAIKLDPKWAAPHNNLALILVSIGLKDEGVTEYRAAMSLDPKYARPHNNLAAVLAELGRKDEAVKEYQVAIALDPKRAAPHHNLANVLIELGNSEEAIKEYRLAIKLDPKWADPHNELQAFLRSVGRDAEADSEAKSWAETLRSERR